MQSANSPHSPSHYLLSSCDLPAANQLIRKWACNQVMTESELCPEKMCLKIFLVVIPKEGLAGSGPANPSLGMTTTIKFQEPENWLRSCRKMENTHLCSGKPGKDPLLPPLILRHVFPWRISLSVTASILINSRLALCYVTAHNQQDWLWKVTWFIMSERQRTKTDRMNRLIAWTSGSHCNMQLQTSFFKPKDSFIQLHMSYTCLVEFVHHKELPRSRGTYFPSFTQSVTVLAVHSYLAQHNE